MTTLSEMRARFQERERTPEDEARAIAAKEVTKRTKLCAMSWSESGDPLAIVDGLGTVRVGNVIDASHQRKGQLARLLRKATCAKCRKMGSVQVKDDTLSPHKEGKTDWNIDWHCASCLQTRGRITVVLEEVEVADGEP